MKTIYIFNFKKHKIVGCYKLLHCKNNVDIECYNILNRNIFVLLMFPVISLEIIFYVNQYWMSEISFLYFKVVCKNYLVI